MNRIESLRYKLYEAIEHGDKGEILRVSRLLDKLIVHYLRRTS